MNRKTKRKLYKKIFCRKLDFGINRLFEACSLVLFARTMVGTISRNNTKNKTEKSNFITTKLGQFTNWRTTFKTEAKLSFAPLAIQNNKAAKKKKH